MQEQINKTRKTLEHFQSFQGREIYLFFFMCYKHKKWPKLYSFCVNIHVVFHDSSLNSLIHFSLLSCNYFKDYTCSWTWITALKTKVDLKFDPLGTVHFIHPTELVFYYYFIVYWRGTQAFVLMLAARMHHQSYQTRNFFKHLFQLL